MNDNRMLWIRNIEKLEESASPHNYYAEYEIASECRIPGILNYGNGKILCGLATSTATYGLYHYFIRFQYVGSQDPIYNKQANAKGYYFKDGVLGEILSLFSLYFQCRFYLIASYQGELSGTGLKIKIPNDFLYRPCNHKIHPKIFHNNRNFAVGLSDFLDSIKSLKNNVHQQFALACYHYANALKEVGVDGEMVFIRLVSSIETLLKDFKLRKKDNPLNGAKLSSIFFKNRFSKPQAVQLRQILCVDNGGLIRVERIRRKFIKFMEAYSKGFLHGGNWKAKHCKIMKKDFPKILEAIYDARSAYLHNGEPMYLSQLMGVSYRWDTDPSCGMIIDNRTISKAKKLPYAYWFEDLVRHCLLQYLSASVKKVAA
jgi:hypothetical protein